MDQILQDVFRMRVKAVRAATDQFRNEINIVETTANKSFSPDSTKEEAKVLQLELMDTLNGLNQALDNLSVALTNLKGFGSRMWRSSD